VQEANVPLLSAYLCSDAYMLWFLWLLLRYNDRLVGTHPHGDRQTAVDVGFLKPALLHDASPLGAQ